MEEKRIENNVVEGRRKKDPASVNLPFSFDIETCSFYLRDDGKRVLTTPEFYKLESRKEARRYQKRGCLVAWGFGEVDHVVFGRTWDEFITLLYHLKDKYKLDPKTKILPVYVHNLSYEFQWIRKRLKWVSVFAVNDRQPLRALCDLGIEFRDSLILSGMSLEKTAESLLAHEVKKMVGDWDYYALRGSKTPLTAKEWGYLENDNMILLAYIAERIAQCGNSVNKIPMTKTGFVREDVRNNCFWDKATHKKDHNHKFVNYSRLMKSLIFVSEEEQIMLKLAFAGGFTHANPMNANKIHENVTSYDLTSSYPAVMCSEKFPMGKGEKVMAQTKEEFETYLKTHCCLMDVVLSNVKSTFPDEHIISRSKCLECDSPMIDNGRIIKAKRIRTIITEIDLQSFRRFYKWDSIEIKSMYVYTKGYLPKAIVEKVIEYYEAKTTLKGVEGKEAEYALAKNLINSMFGMCVYDPIKDEITYKDDEWGSQPFDRKKKIEEYNNSKSRFLSYHWGVWITAYARRNIFSAILETKEDHIYTDTDSEKFLNREKHEGFFKWYNDLITKKITICLKTLGIAPERASPCSVDGIQHPLGVFDFDGFYARFKTLGAKRYAVDYGEDKPIDKRYSLTISGVNKKTAIPAIVKKIQETGKDFFDFFKFGVVYGRDECGKKTHTYIDEETSGKFVDKDGILNEFDEKSFVHLEEATYEMSSPDDYISLLDDYISIAYID